jgi:CRISPR-associated protein (TIGR02584 family)
MNVLICLLGLAPGVATGAYYALSRDRGVPIDRLVTLTTRHPQASDCENEIAVELRRWQRESTGAAVEYDGIAILPEPEQLDNVAAREAYRKTLANEMADACRLRIPRPDVNDEADVAIFREAILALVRDVYREHNLYLCVAGGRKSMAGIAAIAAQLYGDSVRGLYHLYISEELERDGGLDVLHFLPDQQKRRVFRPQTGEVRLVDLAFFQFVFRTGQPGLALRGQMQEYILDFLIENEELVTVLDPDTRGQVLGYVFEAQVADALRGMGYIAVPHYPFADGDIDVLAEKGEELLICECKFHENPMQPLAVKKVDQAIKYRDAMQERRAGCQAQAWVVTNAVTAEDSAWH